MFGDWSITSIDGVKWGPEGGRGEGKERHSACTKKAVDPVAHPPSLVHANFVKLGKAAAGVSFCVSFLTYAFTTGAH